MSSPEEARMAIKQLRESTKEMYKKIAEAIDMMKNTNEQAYRQGPDGYTFNLMKDYLDSSAYTLSLMEQRVQCSVDFLDPDFLCPKCHQTVLTFKGS